MVQWKKKIVQPDWLDMSIVWGLDKNFFTAVFEMQYDANADPKGDTCWRHRPIAYTGQVEHDWAYGAPPPVPVIEPKHNC